LPGLTGDTYGALNELAELSALALAPVCLRLVTGPL
jgi:cobalamin synthase